MVLKYGHCCCLGFYCLAILSDYYIEVWLLLLLWEGCYCMIYYDSIATVSLPILSIIIAYLL